MRQPILPWQRLDSFWIQLTAIISLTWSHSSFGVIKTKRCISKYLLAVCITPLILSLSYRELIPQYFPLETVAEEDNVQLKTED